jgi:pyridoxal phosphate enzyme (YggS family)
MDTIQANIQEIQKRIAGACQRSQRTPCEITLVAVTKSLPVTMIKAAFECGIRDFGESRIQEAELKFKELAGIRRQLRWHMIGHVQSNKARLAARLFDIIHSVDSIKLAHILNKQAQGVLSILIQVNVSQETTKNGFEVEQVKGAIEEIRRLPSLRVSGLMTIAPVADDPEDVRPVFRELRYIRDKFGLEHLSMGMTDDFEVAIEEGATLVRIGRAIFGKRREL